MQQLTLQQTYFGKEHSRQCVHAMSTNTFRRHADTAALKLMHEGFWMSKLIRGHVKQLTKQTPDGAADC